MLKRSTALANAALVTGSIRSLLNAGFIYVFSGPVPDTAGEAIDGSSVLLGRYTESGDGSTGLTFEPVATSGVMVKETTEEWKTTWSASGTATFFRWGVGSDDCEGVAGGSDYRLQGTIGANMAFDMQLANPTVVSAADHILDTAEFQFPDG